MKNTTKNVFGKPASKLFAYFLKQKNFLPEIRSTKYGYCTYNKSWKFYLAAKQIIFTQKNKIFSGSCYENETTETTYQIVQLEDRVTVRFVNTVKYFV